MTDDGSMEHAPARDGVHERVGGAEAHPTQEADNVPRSANADTTPVQARMDRAADTAAREIHHATDPASDWRLHGGATASAMRDPRGGLYAEVRAFVHEKPLESVAIAFAAGCLAGWLLGPRR
jgi:hypothetical protein